MAPAGLAGSARWREPGPPGLAVCRSGEAKGCPCRRAGVGGKRRQDAESAAAIE